MNCIFLRNFQKTDLKTSIENSALCYYKNKSIPDQPNKPKKKNDLSYEVINRQ